MIGKSEHLEVLVEEDVTHSWRYTVYMLVAKSSAVARLLHGNGFYAKLRYPYAVPPGEILRHRKLTPEIVKCL